MPRITDLTCAHCASFVSAVMLPSTCACVHCETCARSSSRCVSRSLSLFVALSVALARVSLCTASSYLVTSDFVNDARAFCVSIACTHSPMSCARCGATYARDGVVAFARAPTRDARASARARGRADDAIDLARDRRALRALKRVFRYVTSSRDVEGMRANARDRERDGDDARSDDERSDEAANASDGGDEKVNGDRTARDDDAHMTLDVVKKDLSEFARHRVEVVVRPRDALSTRELEFPYCSLPRDASTCGTLRAIVESESFVNVVIYDGHGERCEDAVKVVEMFATELEEARPLVATFDATRATSDM